MKTLVATAGTVLYLAVTTVASAQDVAYGINGSKDPLEIALKYTATAEINGKNITVVGYRAGQDTEKLKKLIEDEGKRRIYDRGIPAQDSLKIAITDCVKYKWDDGKRTGYVFVGDPENANKYAAKIAGKKVEVSEVPKFKWAGVADVKVGGDIQTIKANGFVYAFSKIEAKKLVFPIFLKRDVIPNGTPIMDAIKITVRRMKQNVVISDKHLYGL